MKPRPFRLTSPCFAAVFLLAAASLAQAQAPAPEGPAKANNIPLPAEQAKPVRNGDRRRAAKLFLAASKLFEKEQFEEALQRYEQAATLDPANTNYPLAASVARSHAATALIQAAAKSRVRGDKAAARVALSRALEIDPKNPQVSQHLNGLGDDALLGQTPPRYEQGAETVGAAAVLAPASGVHNFHLRSDRRTVIQQVFKAYNIDVTLDQSVRSDPVRLEMDNADFETAARVVGQLTKSFYVPLDAHRVLVASDTKANRDAFMRQDLETVYLPGLSAAEMAEVVNIAKNVFEVPQAATDPSAGTITLRGPQKTLNAFNATMRQLLDGQNQVVLEVRLFQLAHTGQRNTGVHPLQTISAYNLYAEEQSILNANQDLVQEIISSGLAAPGDIATIIGLLIASGQVSSSLFSNGIATFGGGKTLTGVSPGSVSANLSLNSSDSRELDQIQLRLGDGEAGTLRTGSRYPIQTSSYSSLAGSASKIAGLTGAGSSSSLSSLLASYSSVANVPQVEYQDLGLTLKATPKVMRNNRVALTLDLKINALTGGSINGNPILNNRVYSGVVTLGEGEAVAVVSDLDKSESRAVSGTPGISEIPGLNDLTGKDNQKDYATLLIVITPHVVRGTQAAGHSPMMRIERGGTER